MEPQVLAILLLLFSNGKYEASPPRRVDKSACENLANAIKEVQEYVVSTPNKTVRKNNPIKLVAAKQICIPIFDASTETVK